MNTPSVFKVGISDFFTWTHHLFFAGGVVRTLGRLWGLVAGLKACAPPPSRALTTPSAEVGQGEGQGCTYLETGRTLRPLQRLPMLSHST